MGRAGTRGSDGDSRDVMMTKALLIFSLLAIACTGCSSTKSNPQQAAYRQNVRQARHNQHDQRRLMAKEIKKKNRVLKHPMPLGPQVISVSVEKVDSSWSESGQN